jgi:hypothetical protein
LVVGLLLVGVGVGAFEALRRFIPIVKVSDRRDVR